MTHLTTLLTPLMEAGASGGGPSGSAPASPFGACAGGGSTQMLVMMGLVFAIFYFLIIRPSQKREKDRKSMISALKPGDTVVTAGGIVGRITGTAEKYVVVEISPKVRVRVLRAQITGLDDEADKEPDRPAKKSKGGGKGDKNKGRKSSDERAEDTDEAKKDKE